MVGPKSNVRAMVVGHKQNTRPSSLSLSRSCSLKVSESSSDVHMCLLERFAGLVLRFGRVERERETQRDRKRDTGEIDESGRESEDETRGHSCRDETQRQTEAKVANIGLRLALLSVRSAARVSPSLSLLDHIRERRNDGTH